jgi:Luciferase-like monooxygenase
VVGSRGAFAAVVCEHHGVSDGYLPSPMVLATGDGSRTTTLPITVAVVVLPLHQPVRLAEDMAVLDIISRGRVNYVAAIGYVPGRRNAHDGQHHSGSAAETACGKNSGIAPSPGYLGVDVTTMTPELRSQYDYRSSAWAIVLSVDASLAANAGLLQGDVITSFGSTPIMAAHALRGCSCSDLLPRFSWFYEQSFWQSFEEY